MEVNFEGLNRWQKFALIRALDVLMALGIWFIVYGLENVSKYRQWEDWAVFLLSAIFLGLALEIRPSKDMFYQLWCRIKAWF